MDYGTEGDHGHAVVPRATQDLPSGSAVTASGRISSAEVFQEPDLSALPFTPVQLTRLDEALTLASRDSGLRFSVYLGELGANPTATAQRLHAGVEGSDEARVRLPDRGAKLAVMSMVAACKEGDLLGGLLSGLRMLGDQAGARRR